MYMMHLRGKIQRHEFFENIFLCLFSSYKKKYNNQSTQFKILYFMVNYIVRSNKLIKNYIV